MKFSVYSSIRDLIVKITSRFANQMRTVIGRFPSPRTGSNETPLKQISPPIRPPNGKPIFPNSSQEAHERLHRILGQRPHIHEISHEEFMLGWASMAYIAPGLDPDEAALEDGGWPLGWREVAEEAFRRFEAKKLTKAELYPHPPSVV